MTGDYKYDAQLRAEELAEEEFGAEFYSLTNEQKCELYGRALRNNAEDLMAAAELRVDTEREGLR